VEIYPHTRTPKTNQDTRKNNQSRQKENQSKLSASKIEAESLHEIFKSGKSFFSGEEILSTAKY